MPSWGPADASIAIVGLAPAAHGGNRTGRIFTGDRSGDWLFAALYRAGLAAIPTSVSADDDQRLIGTRILAAVHCAPPDNKPTPAERDTCRSWLVRDLELLAPTLRGDRRARRVRLEGALARAGRRGLSGAAAAGRSSGTGRR